MYLYVYYSMYCCMYVCMYIYWYTQTYMRQYMRRFQNFFAGLNQGLMLLKGSNFLFSTRLVLILGSLYTYTNQPIWALILIIG